MVYLKSAPPEMALVSNITAAAGGTFVVRCVVHMHFTLRTRLDDCSCARGHLPQHLLSPPPPLSANMASRISRSRQGCAGCFVCARARAVEVIMCVHMCVCVCVWVFP